MFSEASMLIHGRVYRMGSVLEYSDDEKGYRTWLAQNRGGYVVNQRWKTYLKLHRATCTHIGKEGTKHTNPDADSTKVCGDDLAALRAWVKNRYGREPDPCRACKP
jgi:hypothetical protein